MDITRFEINGMRPFTTHAGAARERLDEAHALAKLIADINLVDGEVFTSLNEDLRRSALDGIANLIAYAVFHLDAATFERQATPAAVNE